MSDFVRSFVRLPSGRFLNMDLVSSVSPEGMCVIVQESSGTTITLKGADARALGAYLFDSVVHLAYVPLHQVNDVVVLNHHLYSAVPGSDCIAKADAEAMVTWVSDDGLSIRIAFLVSADIGGLVLEPGAATYLVSAAFVRTA